MKKLISLLLCVIMVTAASVCIVSAKADYFYEPSAYDIPDQIIVWLYPEYSMESEYTAEMFPEVPVVGIKSDIVLRDHYLAEPEKYPNFNPATYEMLLTLKFDMSSGITTEDAFERLSENPMIRKMEINISIPLLTDQPAYAPGDANGDRKVNAKDVILVLRHIIGKVELTGDSFNAADVTGDQAITAKDVSAILKMILGKTA